MALEDLLRDVMIQALKDLSRSDDSIDSILSWTETKEFEHMCLIIDLESERVQKKIKDLCGYTQPVRKAMIKEIITSVRAAR
jgi:hypothetical protein